MRYSVTVYKSTFCSIEVEADNEEAAREGAVMLALEEDQPWETSKCTAIECEAMPDDDGDAQSYREAAEAAGWTYTVSRFTGTPHFANGWRVVIADGWQDLCEQEGIEPA